MLDWFQFQSKVYGDMVLVNLFCFYGIYCPASGGNYWLVWWVEKKIGTRKLN